MCDGGKSSGTYNYREKILHDLLRFDSKCFKFLQMDPVTLRQGAPLSILDSWFVTDKTHNKQVSH